MTSGRLFPTVGRKFGGLAGKSVHPGSGLMKTVFI